MRELPCAVTPPVEVPAPRVVWKTNENLGSNVSSSSLSLFSDDPAGVIAAAGFRSTSSLYRFSCASMLFTIASSSISSSPNAPSSVFSKSAIDFMRSLSTPCSIPMRLFCIISMVRSASLKAAEPPVLVTETLWPRI